MKKIKILTISTIVIVILLVGIAYALLPGFLIATKQQIIDAASTKLNGSLQIKDLRLTGITQVTADKVQVKDAKENLVFQTDFLCVNFSLFDLVFNYSDPIKTVSKITLANKSQLFLSVDKEGVWNVANLLKLDDSQKPSFYAVIALNDLDLHLSTPENNELLTIKGEIDAAKNPFYQMDIAVKQATNKLKIKGKVSLEGQGNLKVTSNQINAQEFAKIAKDTLGIDDLSGQIEKLNLTWVNKKGQNIFDGSVVFDKLSGNYLLDGKSLNLALDGKVDIKENSLNFKDFSVNANNQSVKVKGQLLLDEFLPIAKNLTISSDGFDISKIYPMDNYQGDLNFDIYLNGLLDKDLQAVSAKGNIDFKKLKVDFLELSDGKIEFFAKDGQLLINKALAKLFDGTVDIKGQYDFKNNIAKGNAIFANVDAGKIINNSDLSGAINSQIAFLGKPTIHDIALEITASSDKLSWRNIDFTNVSATAKHIKNTTLLSNFSANIGKGTVVAQGELNGRTVKANLSSGDASIAEICKAFNLTGYGTLNINADVSGDIDNLYVKADLMAADGVIEKQPLKLLNGSIVLQDKVVSIVDFLAKMNYGAYLLNGTINTATDNCDLTLMSKAIRLEPIVSLVLPDEKITGNIDSIINIKGTMENPLISADISIYEASFRDYFVERIQGKCTYQEGNFFLNDVKINFMQTKVLLDGKIDNKGMLALDFKGDNIRLERSLPPFDAVKVSGGVDLNGNLTGNINKPIFNGKVKASEIFVNDQTLNNVEGFAWSEGGTNNYLRISFTNGDGLYSLDAGVDFTEKFAHGLLEIKNGDVAALTGVAGLNLDIDGRLNGVLSLNEGGKRTGAKLVAQIEQAHVKGIGFEYIDLNLNLHNNKLKINKLEAKQGEGKVVGLGSADFKGDLALELSGTKVNAGLLTAYLGNSVELKGDLNFLIQVSGTAQKPVAVASLQISPGSINDTSFDDLYGLCSLKDEVINIEQLFIAKDIYKASAYGTIPFDLVKKKEQRKNKNDQMDLIVKLDNADLSLLSSIFPSQIEWGIGKTQGQLTIKGDFENPNYFGSISVNDGTMKFKYLRYPLTKINLDVLFEDSKVKINSLKAQMGKGNLDAQGSVNLNESMDSSYNLKLKTDKLEVASDIFTGPITSNFEIIPQKTRRGFRPLLKGDVFLDNTLINLPVVPDFGSSSMNVGLDVQVKLGNNVRLYNKYLYDMMLESSLHITGSANFTNIVGGIKVKKGSIKYLGTVFTISEASAGFPNPGSMLPNIKLLANTQIATYNVYASINGPVTQMDVKLSSNPPLTQQELFRLITLKNISTTGDNSTVTEDDMKGLLISGLQATFLGDVENFIKTTLGLNEFRTYQGQLIGGMGMLTDAMFVRDMSETQKDQYNVFVSKYITDKLLLSYTTSFDNKYRKFAVQYRLNNRWSIGSSIDEDNKVFYGLEYKVSF